MVHLTRQICGGPELNGEISRRLRVEVGVFLDAVVVVVIVFLPVVDCGHALFDAERPRTGHLLLVAAVAGPETGGAI